VCFFEWWFWKLKLKDIINVTVISKEVQLDSVEILTVEEFLEFILLILKNLFFKFVIIKLKFTKIQTMNSQSCSKCTVLPFF
jgi:hypothetical protein